MTRQLGERGQRVKWWLLKYEFPHNTQTQTTFDGWLSPIVERRELGAKLVRYLAAEQLTLKIAGHSWRIADVTDVDEKTVSFRIHRSTGIDYLAAEKDDGSLSVVFGSRYFAEALLYGDTQDLAIQHRTKVARSPSIYAQVLAALFAKALESTGQDHHYEVYVRPKTQPGTFKNWWTGLLRLDSLTIHYHGRNLPTPDNANVVEDIKEIADQFLELLSSEQADIAMKNPKLTEPQVTQLDNAGAGGLLPFAASGLDREEKWTSWTTEKTDYPMSRDVNANLPIATVADELRMSR